MRPPGAPPRSTRVNRTSLPESRVPSKRRSTTLILACKANQTLMILDKPTMLERYILSSIRY